MERLAKTRGFRHLPRNTQPAVLTRQHFRLEMVAGLNLRVSSRSRHLSMCPVHTADPHGSQLDGPKSPGVLDTCRCSKLPRGGVEGQQARHVPGFPYKPDTGAGPIGASRQHVESTSRDPCKPSSVKQTTSRRISNCMLHVVKVQSRFPVQRADAVLARIVHRNGGLCVGGGQRLRSIEKGHPMLKRARPGHGARRNRSLSPRLPGIDVRSALGRNGARDLSPAAHPDDSSMKLECPHRPA